MTDNNPLSSPSGSSQEQDSGNLLEILLKNNLISSAQAQLAHADQEVTGLSLEDIVLARGWINEETLEKLMPKKKTAGAAEDTMQFPPGSRSYDQNLKDYRRLMERILGTGWD